MADEKKMTALDHGPPPPAGSITGVSLQDTRRRIAETAGQIEDRIRRDLDWRHWLDRHPFRSVGIAAAAGLLLGLTVGGSRRRDRGTETVRSGSLLGTFAASVASTVVREGIRIVADQLLSEREPK